jgi:hypothetical protein
VWKWDIGNDRLWENDSFLNLTPKIPCVFLPNFEVFDIVGKINFSKIKVWEFKEVIVGSWSYLVGNQPQKIATLFSMGALGHYNIQTSKFYFFWVFSSLLQN